MKIYKYSVYPGIKIQNIVSEEVLINRLLHVGQQDNQLFVWAEVESTKFPTRFSEKSYGLFPTGMVEIPSGGRYVNTVQCNNGLVWHLYEY